VKAAILRSFGTPLDIGDMPIPAGTGQEVLVQVRGTGVCHSDLHIAQGRYPDLQLPLVLGHEIAGYADGLGAVLVYPGWGCGTCRPCQAGQEQLCTRVREPGWTADGGYADAVLVPSPRYLLPLEGLDPVRAAPLADAGLTPYRAVRRTLPWLTAGATTAIIGIGALGQFAIQYVRLLSEARIVAVDTSATKRDIALTLGADEAVGSLYGFRDLDVVLDLVGTDESLAAAVLTVRRGGVVILVGEAGGRVAFGMEHVPYEGTLATSVSGSRQELSEVLELAQTGQIRWDVEPLPLRLVNTALDRLRDGQAADRLVLVPE